MLLSTLFENAPEIEISQLSLDSRVPMKDAIFFCIKGPKDDAHNFVEDAINNGAKVIVYENDIDTNYEAIFIKVKNVADTLNQVSLKFYDYPSDKLDTYIVAGCYGRSSVASFIESLINKKEKCAYIGALGIKYNGETLMNQFPTLAILDNVKYMDLFVKNGIKACTFESSALNIAYKKLDSVKPKVFIYTNTSADSRDYKELGRDYYSSLEKYFYTLDSNSTVLLNKDDQSYVELSKVIYDITSTYGTDQFSDYRITHVNLSVKGSSFNIEHNTKTYEIKTHLLGMHNVYNLTAAIAALDITGYDINEIIEDVKSLKPISGVVERINFNKYNVLVDCAYTLDSIESMLIFAKQITDKKKKIVGLLSINYYDDENRIKSLMKLADEYLDIAILSEDDSFENDTTSILRNALKYAGNRRCIMVENRNLAIEEGIELLNENDTFVILGKGSENFLYKGLGREYYAGDTTNALKYIRKRRDEENETI